MAELTPSAREAARRLGVSDTAMHKAERMGRIAREPDGQWDITKTRARLLETADPQRSALAGSAAAEGTPFARLKVAQLALKVEAQRLFELVQAGQESLKIKGQAVETAQKSVIANQKSYEAGVKSTTDVLIAIQTLYQTRNEYALSATQQATQLLNLLLVGAEDVDNAVMRTQAFLFRK